MSENQIETKDNYYEQNDKMIIAQNIVFFRKKLKLTQTELATQLKYSNKNISKWENGETTPDIFTLKKLSKIFEVPIDALINPITDENKEAIQTKNVIPTKWKVYLLLLIDSILLLITCIAFFIVKSNEISNIKDYLLFVYLLPILDLSVFIFSCMQLHKVEIISLSLFCWLTLISIHLSNLSDPHIAYIYIIGIGFQLLAIVLAKLINSGKIIKLNKLILKFKKKI